MSGENEPSEKTTDRREEKERNGTMERAYTHGEREKEVKPKERKTSVSLL